MLTKKQVSGIREFLEHSTNPLFLFDNDSDGLCSFLILQKYCRKGRGFPIRSFPELNESYFRKVQELNPDCVFILDKPVVSQSFFDKVHEANIPIVWIDHHETDRKRVPDFVNYFNPIFNRKKSNEPVTALCYQVGNDRSLAWLAVVGSISDKFLPKYYNEVRKNYPDLTIDSKEAFDIFYNSQLGKIARIFSFALKDRTTNVISMIRFLIRASTPYEILQDSPLNYSMHKRFEQIDSKYQRLIKKALRSAPGENKLLYFKYGGALSISADLSNYLSYLFPDKIIAVAYVAGAKANISVRGKGVKEKALKSIEGLESATGGGHKDAAGVRVDAEKLKIFKGRFEKMF